MDKLLNELMSIFYEMKSNAIYIGFENLYEFSQVLNFYRLFKTVLLSVCMAANWHRM